MRVLIIGAGGVGGYFGGRLADASTEVVFAARGRHGDAMAKDGLRIKSGVGDLHIEKPALLGDPQSAGHFDIVLVCTKLWDLESAIEHIKPVVARDTAVIPLQNGVDSEDRACNILDSDNVAGGIAYIAAQIEAPGVIKHTGTMASLAVGELDRSKSKRLEAFQAACDAGGVDCRLSDDIRRDSWMKFVMLTAFSGVTSLYRCPIGPIREADSRRQLLIDLLNETVSVGLASGVALPDAAADTLLGRIEKLPFDMKSSMLVDLERGNRLELDWLSGTVCRLGKDLGLPTPAHVRIVAELEPFKQGS